MEYAKAIFGLVVMVSFPLCMLAQAQTIDSKKDENTVYVKSELTYETQARILGEFKTNLDNENATHEQKVATLTADIAREQKKLDDMVAIGVKAKAVQAVNVTAEEVKP